MLSLKASTRHLLGNVRYAVTCIVPEETVDLEGLDDLLQIEQPLRGKVEPGITTETPA